MTFPSSSLVVLAIAAFVGWRLYRRFRKLGTRQRLPRVRPWIHVTLFPAALALVAFVALFNPTRLAWLAGGLVLGAVLATQSLRLTRFETTAEGLFYTPNAWFGIAIVALLLARVGWRIVEIADKGITAARANAEFLLGGPTLAVFGIIGAYYTAYAIGLLRWRRGALSNREA